jgi:DNA-binding IclR family transcriptional regulator
MSKVLLKGLMLLEAVAAAREDVGVTELARGTRNSKATVYRFLDTLVQAGYLEQDPHTSRYRLTQRLRQVALRTPAPPNIADAARPILRRLVEKTGETAYLAVLSGTECLFLDRVDSDHPLRVHTTSGSRFPLHVGAASKALLAFQSDHELLASALNHLHAVTSHTITSKAGLLRDLAAIRERGYAISQSEWREGISAVAAPVRDMAGRVVAALAVSGPTSRLPVKQLTQIAPYVVRAGAALSAALGWSAPRAAARARRRTS